MNMPGVDLGVSGYPQYFISETGILGAQPLESVGYLAIVLKFHVIQNWIVNFHQKLLAMVNLQNNNMTALLRSIDQCDCFRY